MSENNLLIFNNHNESTLDIELNNEEEKNTETSTTKINKNEEDFEEQQHFYDVINTFRYYKHFNIKKVEKRIKFVNEMSKNHQELLKNYSKHLNKVQISILHNYEIIKIIIGDSAKMFKNCIFGQDSTNSLKIKPEKELDISRIDSVINQIVREWCMEGFNERDSCFTPILNAIENYFPFNKTERHQIKILVPGAGLGRLPFEIAKRGYSCQGNEFSLMMLIVANFILNKIDDTNVFTLYPWVTQFSNNLCNDHQTLPVKFPDVNPASIPKNVDFSMVAGSFTEIFQNNYEQFDCLVTCFFLDTAQNIVCYIETIYNILKSGGIWINFGPLLYHYADMNELSIEPSYEIIKEIIESFNFKFLEEKTNITTYYTRNPNSMVSYQYHSVYFVCRK